MLIRSLLVLCEHLFTFKFAALMPKISKENFAQCCIPRPCLVYIVYLVYLALYAQALHGVDTLDKGELGGCASGGSGSGPMQTPTGGGQKEVFRNMSFNHNLILEPNTNNESFSSSHKCKL